MGRIDEWMDEAVVSQPPGTTVWYNTPQFWVRNILPSRKEVKEKKRREKQGR